ncbi:cupredoxin domain-containing protein [Euzebya tangerina]|uniref:cupredoxin domain-containing protein n=1 Tax=Euzebya tangerina TaxID=591198 RepID=UPI000E31D7A1|nr:hypothetical protein [Euzebya tangerina]
MSPIRSLRTLVLALLLVVVCLAGAASAATQISLTGDSVEPDPAAAVVGEPVMFSNDSDAAIRLIDDEGRWDSGELPPGGTFQITFNEEGVIRFSSQDGSLTGSVEVTAAGDDDGDQTSEAAVEQPTALADTGISAALIAAGGVGALVIGILLLVRTRKQ